jgi:hypothetical protein
MAEGARNEKDVERIKTMILPISKDKTIQEIRVAQSMIKDPYYDGFNQWNLKKILYEIKFELDEVLEDCGNFIVEAEWLEEQEKKKMWRKLKK